MIRGVGTRAELNAQLNELNVQPSHIVTLPCGKTFDLTNPYGTPFGMFDGVYGAGAAEAMKAHGGPYEWWYNYDEWKNADGSIWKQGTIYRVRLAPFVETITQELWRTKNSYLNGYSGDDKQAVILTFTRTNGVVDDDSYRWRLKE